MVMVVQLLIAFLIGNESRKSASLWGKNQILEMVGYPFPFINNGLLDYLGITLFTRVCFWYTDKNSTSE